MKTYRNVSTRITPQSEPILGSTQVQNNAGGYAWALDDWKRLDRFLVLGSEGGTYYTGERKLTVENAAVVLRCLAADGPRTVGRIVELSESGRCPKNDPALFALALAAGKGNELTKQTALFALPRVARTGTHLFSFADYVENFRGWGPALRKAVSHWYTAKDATYLAYQLAKYQQRNGRSHKDLLRLCHVKPTSDAHAALYRWVVDRGNYNARSVARGENGGPVVTKQYDAVNASALPGTIAAFERVQSAESHHQVIAAVTECPALSWEMIPSEHLAKAEVWEALLPNLPYTALLRNLARMTASELISPMSSAAELVTKRLTDETLLRKSRVHPIAVLGALTTYQSGHGVRGSLSWDPVASVVDALNTAFHQSFGNVRPCGKRMLLALDVSGSMECGEVSGMAGVTPCMGAAAMAMVTARVETSYEIMGFAHEFRRLGISAHDSLTDAMSKAYDHNFGGTDCALPMLWALEHRVPVDTFVVYTDNETWAGEMHPSQALHLYRERTGIPAKLVVVGMTSDGFSIADPDDDGMLDVVGFDTAAPQLIADFAVA